LLLFLVSATLLFVELLLLRWVPANVIYVGFFNNFLLMASFLGIGLGILIGKDGLPRPLLASLLLAGIAVLVVLTRIDLRSSGRELFYGANEQLVFDVNFVVLPVVILLVTAVMAALALPLGTLLRSFKPLHAYGIDITGSLLGIAMFAGLSAVGTPPVVWFAIAALLVVAQVVVAMQQRAFVVGVAIVLSLVGFASANSDERWSPYYRIAFGSFLDGTRLVFVNGILHQAMWEADNPNKEPFYEQLYRWFPDRTFSNALIVGAGTGTDAAIALRHNVKAIDAVELDPVILDIGIAEHPDHPYDDPRVRTIVNDGRAYLRQTDKRYDLVIFAQTDTLSLVTSTANLRRESFLFTEEAFASVRQHLAPGGIFVLYNEYRDAWLVGRLGGMLADTFDHPPLLRTYARDGRVSAAIFAASVEPLAAPADAEPVPLSALPAVRDDWPFLYVQVPSIAPRYVVSLGALLVFGGIAVWGATRRRRASMAHFSPHFFALGAAFLLLETRSLVVFSLLFGTTWIVNALVFFGILASVLVAILVNARFPRVPAWPLYAALFGSLAVNAVLPPASLLFDPPLLRYIVAAALAFVPVICANLVFTRSFRESSRADVAFASNLIGAVVGGVLEWGALIVGYEALLGFVAALYLVAALFASRWRLLGDHALAAPSAAERYA
jgi:predicted membrane-bound spermidine synthase